MNIAIIGYGKMGKAIEQIAIERGHQISLRVDAGNAGYGPEVLQNTDVAIEFSRPESATENIRKCFAANVPVVVGTTGWYDEYEAITEQCKAEQKALLAATNFSVGVNLFFAINKHVAALMNGYSEYDVNMEEIHHTQKLDAPSGTGITLAEGILEMTDRKEKWVNEPARHESELALISKRIDAVPGTHTIRYQSEIDDIELTHTAHNRKGFATGAVLAAEWLAGKTGVYQMADVLNLS